MYKTLDGYTLKPGDKCYVHIEVPPECDQELNHKTWPAIYLSENAVTMGWDFELPTLNEDYEVGVVDVYKYYPGTQESDKPARPLPKMPPPAEPKPGIRGL